MRDFLARSGIVIRPEGKITPDGVLEMVRLREAGWTYREIGDKFDVTRYAVAMRLKCHASAKGS